MWRFLAGHLGLPLAVRDGVGVGSRLDIGAAEKQYQQLRATSRTVTEYYAKDQAGDPSKEIKQETTKDLVALSRADDLTSDEVATVKGILAKIEGGKELTDGDVQQLQAVVKRLQDRLVSREQEAIADPNTDAKVLGQLSLSGVTQEVEFAATEALVARAKASKDPRELAELIKPAGKDGAVMDNVLEAVAANPNASPDTLSTILHKRSHSAGTERALAANPHAPVRDLLELTNKGLTPEVKKDAEKNLSSRGPEMLEVFKQMDRGWTSDAEYAAMRKLASLATPEVRAQMIEQLESGYTSGDAENCIHAILQDARAPEGSPPSLVFQQLVARLDLGDLESELDGKNWTDAKKWVEEATKVMLDPARPLPADEAIQAFIVRQDKAPAELLHKVFTNGVTPAVKQAAEKALADKATKSDSFAELAELAKFSEVPKLRLAIAANTNTGKQTLADLADPAKTPATDAATQRLIAKNPNASLDTLKALRATGLDADVKKDATTVLVSRAQATASSTDLDTLAGIDDPAINEAIAGNTAATSEVLKEVLNKVSRSPRIDAPTQAALAANPKAPVDVLRDLQTNGKTPAIKTAAKDNLVEQAKKSEDPNILLELATDAATDADILKGLINNKLTPPSALAILADPAQTPTTNADAQEVIAEHGWTSAETLKKLKTTGLSADVKSAAAKSMEKRAVSGQRPTDLRFLVGEVANAKIRNGLAANDRVPPDVLDDLAKTTNDPATQALILANPRSSVATIDALRTGGADATVKAKAAAALAARATSTKDPGQLRHLADISTDPAVLKAVAANKLAPADVLAKLAGSADATVQEQVAKNDRTPVAALDTLAKNGLSQAIKDAAAKELLDRAKGSDPAVLQQVVAANPGAAVLAAVAANKAAAPAVLAGLATNADPAIQEAVAGNPGTPVADLERLRTSGSAKTKQAAEATLLSLARTATDPAAQAELLKSGLAGVGPALAGNPQAAPAVLLELADKTKYPATNAALQQALLANPAVTGDVLRQLEKDGASADIQKAGKDALADLAAAGNAATPAAKLKALAEGKPSRELERALLANPATPNDAVSKQIVRDGKVSPEEITALRDRVIKGKLTAPDVTALLKTAGFADKDAGELAGWLTKEDEQFKLIFGVGGAFPLTVDLEPGKKPLQILSHTGYDEAHAHRKGGTIEPNDKISLDPLRAPVTVTSGPTPGTIKVKYLDATGADKEKTVDTVDYVVRVRGKDVTVQLPKYGTSAGEIPTLETIMASLALLPPKHLDRISPVVVSTDRNAADENWEVWYKKPNFRSFATAGNQPVRFYPVPDEHKQSAFDSAISHEGGHRLSHQTKVGSDSFHDSAEWKAAIAKDGVTPSDYAGKSNAEDFAEAVSLYLLGGKDDPAVRARFGARFAALDKLFAP